MGRIVQIRHKAHFIAVLEVLDELPGMWHARGNPSAPTLLVTDAQFKALVKARVVDTSDSQEKTRGKKAVAKKARS